MPKISQTQRDSRRERVLEAALACFSEDGFHQTGMADIVRRSGMSHGAVYVYFQSKDDIIEALADDRHRNEAILNSAAQQADDPIAGLHGLVRAHARGLTDESGEARRRVGVHGWAEALRSPRVRARVLEGIDIPRSLIVGLVERAQFLGRLSNDVSADAVARSFIALFQGFVLQVAWGESIDVDACVAVVDRMLQGLAPSDPKVAARKARGD
jgi:AcrR family transcriptional regulator